jgi:hypothetical protein
MCRGMTDSGGRGWQTRLVAPEYVMRATARIWRGGGVNGLVECSFEGLGHVNAVKFRML